MPHSDTDLGQVSPRTVRGQYRSVAYKVNAKMLEISPDLYHLLPPVVSQLAHAIGYAKAFRIVEQIGGNSFLVGSERSETGGVCRQKLVDAVGPDDAARVEHVFQGEMVYIPRLQKIRQIMQRRSVRLDFDELTRTTSACKAVRALANKYALSDRHVWRVLKQVD